MPLRVSTRPLPLDWHSVVEAIGFRPDLDKDLGAPWPSVSGPAPMRTDLAAPTVAKGECWDGIYPAKSQGLDVPPAADWTVPWVNGLVAWIGVADDASES